MTEEGQARELREKTLMLWRAKLPCYRAKVHELDSQGAGILAMMLFRYVTLNTAALEGQLDELSNSEAAEAQKELEETYYWLEPILGRGDKQALAVHLETISGIMYECGYSAEERAKQRLELQSRKMGRPLTEHSLRVKAEALTMHLNGKSYNEIANMLCEDKATHNPHVGDTTECKEDACTTRFRKEATRLKNFLDAYGYEFVKVGQK